MSITQNIPENEYHVPVLREEAVGCVVNDTSGVYVDGTLGGGGHSEALLERLSEDGRVIGIDRDAEAIDSARKRLSRFGDRLCCIHDRFGRIDAVLDTLSIRRIDGLLLDLGVSSRQIDAARRGFSYSKEGPLDMRMDGRSGLTAADIVNGWPEKKLSDLFFVFGEEKKSRQIARRIVYMREKTPLESTTDLADAVRACTPARWHIKSLSRIFQALRIAVNGEMEELADCLVKIYPSLKTGGRVAVIMYHGLESRVVKRYFRGEEPSFTRSELAFGQKRFDFRSLTPRGIRASESEIRKNPRARSAVLRAAEKRGG